MVARGVIKTGLGERIGYYFIALFGTGMLGIFHPAMMFAGWLLGIVVCAIICMLYIARTRAFGAYTVMGLVVGVLMVATGHAWITPLISTPLGLAADAVTRSGGYTRTVTNALGFSIFSMWIIGPLLPIIWASDAYFADISRSMGQEYADGYRSLVTVPVIAGYGDRVTSWSSPSSTSSDAPDQENNETPCEPRRARRFAGTVSAHPCPPTGFSEVM